jgi:hypothetical protein
MKAVRKRNETSVIDHIGEDLLLWVRSPACLVVDLRAALKVIVGSAGSQLLKENTFQNMAVQPQFLCQT